MGEQTTVTLDDDLYDRVCTEHRETGKSKSKIVNQRVREGYAGRARDPTLADTALPQFGEGLFVAGFVSAFYAGLTPATGALVFFGLALLIGAKVDDYRAKHDVGPVTALIRVLGA